MRGCERGLGGRGTERGVGGRMEGGTLPQVTLERADSSPAPFTT